MQTEITFFNKIFSLLDTKYIIQKSWNNKFISAGIAI